MVSTDLTHITPAGNILTGDPIPTVRGGNSRNVTFPRFIPDPGKWVDLRNYGGYPAWPLAPDLTQIDITAALNAAFTDLATKKNKTLFIPEISNIDGFASDVRLEITSTVTIPQSTTGPGWTILIQAQRMGLRMTGGAGSKGIILPGQIHIKGLAAGRIATVGPYIARGPDIVGNSGHNLESMFYASGQTNILLENLRISADIIGVNFQGVETSTIRQCNVAAGNVAAGRGIIIESAFWINIEESLLSVAGSNTSAYCLEVVDDSGLMLIKDTNFSAANAIYLNGLVAAGAGIQNLDIFDALQENINGAFLTIDSTSNPIDGIRCYRCATADAAGNDYTVKNTGGKTRGVRFVDCGNVRIDPASTNIAEMEVIQPAQTGSGRIDRFPGAAGTTESNYGYTFHDSVDKKLLSAQRSPFTMIADADSTVVQDGSLWTNLGSATRVNNVLAPDGSLNATQFTGDAVANNDIRGIYSKTYTPSVGDWFIGAVWLQKMDALAQAIGFRVFFNMLWGTSGTGSAFNGNTGYGQPTVSVGAFSDVRSNPAWRFGITAQKLTALGTGNLTVTMEYRCFNNTIYRLYMPSVIFIPASAGWSDYDITAWVRTVRGTWSSDAKAGEMIMPYRAQRLRSNLRFPAMTFATLPSSPLAGMQSYITDSNTATHGATVAAGGTNKVMVWYNGTNWTVVGS